MSKLVYSIRACLLAALIASPCIAKPSGQEVLERLRRFDAIYMSSLTVKGAQVVPPSPLKKPGVPEVTRKWKMTLEGSRAAIIQEAKKFPDPTYQEPDSSPWVSHNPEGNNLIGILTKQYNYYGTDLAGTFQEYDIYVVNPLNNILDITKTREIRTFGPTDAGPTRERKEILWSLGRGYSGHIKEITHVKELPEGRLAVVALGKKSDVFHGRWELIIDTKATWIVREARFFHQSYPKKVNFEVKNSGLRWEESLAIPEKATSNYSGPIDANSMAMGFEEANDKVDEALMAQAHQALLPPYPPSTTVVSFQPSGTLVFEPDEAERLAKKQLEEAGIEQDVQAEIKPLNRELATTTESKPQPESSVLPPALPERPWYLLPRIWAYILLCATAIMGLWFLRVRKGDKTK